MATASITIKDRGGHNVVPTWTFQTEAAATAIAAGEFVKWKSNGSPYVIPLADADGVIGTMVGIVGLAASAGTHTASADGKIDVYLPLPGVIYEIKAKTSTLADTQAEIDALVGDRVIIDVTGSVWTLDSAAGEAQASPFVIVGGDPERASFYVALRSGATFLGDQDLS